MAIIPHPSSVIPPVYRIDLLKGEGIPIRSRPGGTVLACLIVVVPLLLGLAMTNLYMDGQVVLSIQRQELGRLKVGIETLSQALRRKELLDQEKTRATAQLSDIKTALDAYTQWSQTLAAVVESLSDTLVLTRLEARRDIVRRKVPAKEDPAKKVEVSVPARTLKLCVCGPQAATASQAVRSLQEDLRSSPVIAPLLDTITVSQNTALLDSQEAVLYELECVLKTPVE